MVDVWDIVFPIVSLVAFALLTVPFFKLVRRTTRKTAMSVGWIVLVYVIVFLGIGNLWLKYYSVGSPPTLNIPLADTPLAAFSSALMVDAVSVYMAIIITAVSSVVLLYSVFYIKSGERPSERYYAVMLMLTAALLGTVFSGDLLTLFIFWEAAAAGSGFLMVYRKRAESLNAALKYLVMIIIASALVVFGLSLVYGLTGSLNFLAVKGALVTLT